jgi:hypothetical protein
MPRMKRTRDLVRARATAGRVLSKARQHLQGFLLRHDRSTSRSTGRAKAMRARVSNIELDVHWTNQGLAGITSKDATATAAMPCSPRRATTSAWLEGFCAL